MPRQLHFGIETQSAEGTIRQLVDHLELTFDKEVESIEISRADYGGPNPMNLPLKPIIKIHYKDE